MGVRNKKQPAMPPSSVEALGRMSPEELQNVFHPDSAAADILRQLDAVNLQKLNDRQMARDAERSEVARASCPPHANRGDKGQTVDSVRLVLDGGVIKEIPARRGWGGDSAFIDWVNFTIGEESIVNGKDESAVRFGYVQAEDGQKGCIDEYRDGLEGLTPVTCEQVMVAMSHRLHQIFGYGITSKRSKGLHFYRDSWNVGNNWGTVAHGGNRGTILVSISGDGCAAAKNGWEYRLKAFLESCNRANLSRVDFAHDDFTGETYNVDRADQEHTDGLFHIHGRQPDCEHRGNWKRPNGKGRTLNVGNRKNGKFCRVYEKGRQLGDENSEWVRIEVEFKSIDRVIPFDALLHPGEYLAAAYPAFAWIAKKQTRIETTQKVTEATVEKAVKWIRHQCGASIGLMVELFGKEDFLKKVIRDGSPSWFKVPHFSLADESIHQRKKETFPVVLSEQAASWA